MKFNIPKDWTMSKAAEEQGQNIEAGKPALTREQWLAEVRRLYVEKYKFVWSAKAVAEYADALAEVYWEDGTCDYSPDEAIMEDLSYGF